MITLCNNKKIIPDNLAQIDHNSLEKLRKSDLVNLSLKLCTQLCAALELLNQNSSSSSKPPSLDNPYEKKTTENSDDSKEAPNEQDELEKFEEDAQSGDSIEEKKE